LRTAEAEAWVAAAAPLEGHREGSWWLGSDDVVGVFDTELADEIGIRD
jgi:hypothetical protein